MKTYTYAEIARQRDRVVEAALQSARCRIVGMYIDDDGMVVRLPEPEHQARAFSKSCNDEAELLLVMLSTGWPAHPEGGGS